ncbi:alpha/beta-hydrolase, partial [Imleria badia]
MSATTWGDPNATKHVLLLHGLTSSSHTWYRIAQDALSPFLPDTGYFVTAPDLLGHGLARRSSDYSIAALANELRPLLANNHSYHCVVGHSLGGVVAAALLPLLHSTRPVHVVLVDPPLEQSPELAAQRKARIAQFVANPQTPEAYLEIFPNWTIEDALFRYTSTRLCNVATVEAIFDQNVPWSFTHHLLTAPDNVKLTVLAADPAKDFCVREEDLEKYPHVTAKTVWGASHLIPVEYPNVVVETAL